MDIEDLVGWPALRQLLGSDRSGRGAAVKSRQSKRLTNRNADADRVVKSVCPYCAVGCGQNVFVKDGRVVQIEGRPRLAGQPWAAVPQGVGDPSAHHSEESREEQRPLPPPYGTEWERLDWRPRCRCWLTACSRPGRTVGSGRTTVVRVRRTMGIASLGGATLGQRGELPDQEAVHGAWGSSRSRTRPGCATPRLSRDWERRLAGGARPPSRGTCRTPTASSSRARTWPRPILSPSSG